VDQSSSQHEKCQVGNMHTYSLDLVHFPIHSFIHYIIIHSLIQLSHVPLRYFHCTCIIHESVSIPVHVPVPMHVPSEIRSWTKEAGCQAHGILNR
jgi:hypothetical protein